MAKNRAFNYAKIKYGLHFKANSPEEALALPFARVVFLTVWISTSCWSRHSTL